MGPPTQPITRPEFAALDKPMSRRRPAEYKIAKDAQRDARLHSIGEGIAKTPAERTAAVNHRKKITKPMYDAARNDPNPVNIQPTLDLIDEILYNNPKRPLVQTKFNELKSLLTNVDEGVRTPITSARETVSAIEGFKDLFKNQDNATIKDLLQKTKFKLMNDVPLYHAADVKYRELSRPVNQMDAGTYIHKKLANEKRPGDIEGTSQFLGTVDDARRTIKNSLDEPRYNSLEELFDQPQLTILDNAQREINRDAVIAAQVQAGSFKMAEDLKQALDPIEIPGFLQREVTLIRNIMARMKGAATHKTMNYLSDRQLSGPEFAAIKRAATPKERTILNAGEGRNKRGINKSIVIPIG